MNRHKKEQERLRKRQKRSQILSDRERNQRLDSTPNSATDNNNQRSNITCEKRNTTVLSQTKNLNSRNCCVSDDHPNCSKTVYDCVTDNTKECVLNQKDSDLIHSSNVQYQKVNTPERKSVNSRTSFNTVEHRNKSNIVFDSVDLNWQVEKCLEINTLYDAELNIHQNLYASQPCQIDAPGTLVKIVGDGNCFFRCVSYLVCGDQSYNHMRQVLLLHMCSYSQVLSSLLPSNTTMVQYMNQSRMMEDNIWATQVEIISMAHLLRTDIYTYSRYGNQFKWLKHSPHFVDNSIIVNNKAIYLDHHTGDHFDVVTSVGHEKTEKKSGEKNMLWSEVLKQTNITKQEYHRLYKQKQRSIPDLKNAENQQRNKTRAVKRSYPENKQNEYKQRDKTRAVKRADPENKQNENKQRDKTRSVKRSDPENRQKEYKEFNKVRSAKRSDPKMRQNENKQRDKTRSVKRSDPEKRRKEYKEFNKVRSAKRSDPKMRQNENKQRDKTRSVKRSDPEIRRKEYKEFNKVRSAKRSDPKMRQNENKQRDKTRAVKRSDPENRQKEYKEFNRVRSAKRSDPKMRQNENKQRDKTRAVKRSDPENRQKEYKEFNRVRSAKRSDPKIRQNENKQRDKTRAVKRSDPENRQKEYKEFNRVRSAKRSDPKIRQNENKQRDKTRAVKRCNPIIKHAENLKRKRKRHAKRRIRGENASLERQVDIFRNLLKRGDEFVCTCCHQTYYQHSVYTVGHHTLLKKGISEDFLNNVLTNYKSVSDQEWICKTCYKYISLSKIPPMSVANGFTSYNLPKHLSSLKPTETEERCSALRIPFMQLKQLGVGKQMGIYGNTVNVPMNPAEVVSSLPRRFEDTETIHLLFKRRSRYKSAVYHETVRPKVIYDLTKYFIENSDLYKEEGVQLNEEWLQHEEQTEVSFASEEDMKDMKNFEQENKKDEKVEESEDTWNELTEEEQACAGNRDTLFQNVDFTDDGVHALQIAPGENQNPTEPYKFVHGYIC